MLFSRAGMTAVVFVCLLASTSPSQQPGAPAAFRGYSDQASRAEREWENKFRAVPDPANLREYMRIMSREPHHAGSPASRQVAEFILSKFRSWGLEAELEEFQVLLPTPKERVVELLQPTAFQAALREPPVREDPDSTDANQLPTFNAYSADGDVTAQLVYVNYGVPADYEQLAKLGIDVKGKIAIARYGGSWRGIKPKVAAEHGAIGCLIYSDPRDDGYFGGDAFPGGAYRPPEGVQRGSVMDMPIYAGDPLTPGWAAVQDAKRLALGEARTLMKIPVLPISYADATPLLQALRGPVAPQAWRGALPFTYHVGPGPAVVHLKAIFDWGVRPIYDVVARIPGSDLPGQWVLYGNHHDAWVNGADDPLSGQASLMETARGLAQLRKQGWKPRRTIILAAWDAEEWGLIGSTEWAEKHAAELSRSAVMYLNSDTNTRGYLGMSGSHTLERFINDVARDIPDPEHGKSVWQSAYDRKLAQAKTDEDKKKIRERADMEIGALGSGSDYTPFLQHLGIASLNLGFSGNGGGVYHSIYDSYYWYRHFGDPKFDYGRALSEVTGTVLMRMADAPLLPFEFDDFADTIAAYEAQVEKLAPKEGGPSPALDFAPLREAVQAVKKSAAVYEAALRSANIDSAHAQANELLYTTERAMTTDKGLPGREWYRHLVYAPGLSTGYEAKTLPTIREAIERKKWDEARQQIPIVAGMFENVAKQIDAAARALQ